MKTKTRILHLLTVLGLAALFAPTARAQSTTLTYQGRLADSGSAVNTPHDFRFRLYDAVSGGNQVGSQLARPNTAVEGGVFTEELDFGAAAFNGASRWLEVEVSPAGANTWTIIAPRHFLASAPYAMRATKAGTADTATSATTATSVAAGGVNNAALQNSAVDSAKIADNSIGVADLSPGVLNSTFWRLGGNTGTAPGSQFFGTLDNQALAFRVNNAETLRLQPGGKVGIGTTAPGKALQVGDVNVVGSEGIIRLASRTSSGAGVGRVWDVGVPQTGDNAAGEGYSFVVRDVNNPAAKPPFMIRYDTHNIGLGTTNPLAKLEIQAGADQDGANDPRALSLAHRTGGFRHWIRSRHNSAEANNGIDFFVNTNSTAAGSSAPGTGSRPVMTLDSITGVNAVGGLVIENRASDPINPVNGQIWLLTNP